MIRKFKKIKEEAMQNVIILALLPFNFFVFGMIELYLGNLGEWPFHISYIVKLSLIAFSVTLLLLMLINKLLKKYFSQKFSDYFCAFIFGLGIALYIQGNFLNGDYGLLNGQSIVWEKYSTRGYISSLMWAICTIIPIFLVKSKIYPRKILMLLSCILITTQIVTLGVFFIRIGDAEYGQSDVLTNENIFNLSDNKNVVVFVLDAFDSSDFKNLISSDVDIISDFQDFTYFDNMASVFNQTQVAIPQILTGEKYLNEIPYNDYLENSFEKSPLLKELHEKKYDVGIYSINTHVGNSQWINNQKKDSVKVDLIKLTTLYTKFTAFKYFPQVAKAQFNISSNEFTNIAATTDANDLYDIDTVSFYNMLKEHGIETNVGSPVFRFYHVFGMHQPYKLNEFIEYNDNNTATSREQAAKGSINLVRYYIDLLKKEGVYDKTTIVIMADHGSKELMVNPLFLIKQQNEQHSLIINSAPVSYSENLMPTLLKLIETDENTVNNTVYDVSENENINRKVYRITPDREHANGYYFDLYEYQTTGKIYDYSNFEFTGRTFSSANNGYSKLYKYKLGTVLKGSEILNAVITGFLGDSEIYSYGKEFMLCFDIGERPNSDLLVEIKLKKTVIYPSKLRIFVNGEEIQTKDINQDNGTVSFNLLNSSIRGTVLNLKFEVIGIDDISLINQDEIYSYCWDSIVIREQEQQIEDIAGKETLNGIVLKGGADPRNGTRSSKGINLLKDGVWYGFYISMAKGKYQISINGENLDRCSFYITAMENGNVFNPELNLVKNTDSQRIYQFELQEATVTDFVVYNTNKENLVLDHLFLQNVWDSEQTCN